MIYIIVEYKYSNMYYHREVCFVTTESKAEKVCNSLSKQCLTWENGEDFWYGYFYVESYEDIHCF